MNEYYRAVSRYNSAARAHKARVQQNRARLQRELAKLSNSTSQPRYVNVRSSVNIVQHAYAGLEARVDVGAYSENYDTILDLSEREATNSASVMDALRNNPSDLEGQDEPQESELDPILKTAIR